MKVSGQRDVPTALFPGKADLDAVAKANSLPAPPPPPPNLSLLTILTELPGYNNTSWRLQNTKFLVSNILNFPIASSLVGGTNILLILFLISLNLCFLLKETISYIYIYETNLYIWNHFIYIYTYRFSALS
jgi:hypothetical protein